MKSTKFHNKKFYTIKLYLARYTNNDTVLIRNFMTMKIGHSTTE